MKSKKTLVFSTIVAAFGGLLFGFDTAVIAGTTKSISTIYDLTAVWLGVTVSIALWGTVIGALVAGIPGDKFGRKVGLLGTAVLFFVSAAGCAMAWDWTSLVIFRFVGGLGVGAASVLGPMYIAEISPPKWRGRMVGFFQFNVVLGILVAYLSNAIIGRFDLGDLEWRWKLGIEAVPAAIFFLSLFFVPKSPRWLVKVGRINDARLSLEAIGDENVEEELAQIVQSIDEEHGHAVEPLLLRKYRLPIFLAITVAMFNQFSGINALLYYLNDIFSMAGFDKLSGDLQSVVIGATNLVSTMVGMALIDRFGRRPLLMVGSAGMAVCLGGIAAIFFMSTHQSLLAWLLIGYISFFGFSTGAVIWVYISEVFPNRVRAKGQSLGSFTHWFMCALVAGSFPALAKESDGYPFVFFSAMMILQLIVVWKWYPETQGISLEQMQKRLGIE